MIEIPLSTGGTARGCTECGGDLAGRRADAKFCGAACKSAYHRGGRRGHFITHGMSNHPLYPTWCNMVARCHNPSTRTTRTTADVA